MTDDAPPAPSERPALDPQEAARVGLCATCVSSRRITSAKGSTFWMCQAPERQKYPPLPVLRCGSFEPKT